MALLASKLHEISFLPQLQLDLPTSTKQQAQAAKTATTKTSSNPLFSLDVCRAQSKNNITVGLCHKTLFGDVDLEKVAAWAVYNRLLGMDAIYIGFLPEMRQKTGFEILDSLPYVHTYENTLGKVRTYSNGYVRINRDSNPGYDGDQKWDEYQCFRAHATHHDWIFMADADEFLWFNQKIGVHEFLQRYQDYNYLSFGKYMYDTLHRVHNDKNDNVFGMESLPFTALSHCRHRHKRQKIGSDYCPTWRGRSKLAMRPEKHRYSEVHGPIQNPSEEEGQKHFKTAKAHWKEWNGLFKTGPVNVTTVERRDFIVSNATHVSIHNLWNGHKANEKQGNNKARSWTLHYDDKLQDWLDYVLSRACTTSTPTRQ